MDNKDELELLMELNRHNLNASLAFVEVARAGGFRKAADTLGIPASTVSNQVARLETALGIKLLDRTTRSVRLTDAGQAYMTAAGPALEALTSAAQAAMNVAAIPSGRLHITMPIEFGQMYMAQIVSSYATQFPHVTLNCDLSNRRVNVIGDGFDVAIRAGQLTDSSLVCRAVGPIQQLITCASPQYLSRQRIPRAPQDLSKHDCLVMSDASATTAWKYQTSGQEESVALTPTASVNNYFALKELAMLGHGIIRIPRFLVANEIAAGSLKEVLRTKAMPGLAFHILYPVSGRLSPKIGGFVSIVDEILSAGTRGSGVRSWLAARQS